MIFYYDAVYNMTNQLFKLEIVKEYLYNGIFF